MLNNNNKISGKLVEDAVNENVCLGRKRDYIKKDNPLKRMETKNDTETDQ